MSTSRQTLIQNIAKDKGLGYGSGTCSAAGTATTIIDTSADSPFDVDDDNTLYANAWAKIESDSAATPLNVGEVRRVDATGYNATTQTLTTRAFTNSTTVTQSYAVYLGRPPTRVGITPGIDEAINETLRSLSYRERSLLTLVTDGDMETSTTTSWTASNSTLSKVTTAAYVRLGTRCLRVQNSAANGYVRPATHLSVAEGQSYQVRADFLAAVGTAKLQLYDETNAAAIRTETAVTGVTPQRFLYFQDTIPTGCKQVSVRLIGSEITADIYWDNVSLRNANGTEIGLPSWVTGRGQVEELEEWEGGLQSATGDDFSIDETDRPVVRWWDVVEDPIGATPFRVTFWPKPFAQSLLVVRGIRPGAELSADSDTTVLNADLVKAGALCRIYWDKEDGRNYGRWLNVFNALCREHLPRFSKRIIGSSPY